MFIYSLYLVRPSPGINCVYTYLRSEGPEHLISLYVAGAQLGAEDGQEAEGTNATEEELPVQSHGVAGVELSALGVAARCRPGVCGEAVQDPMHLKSLVLTIRGFDESVLSFWYGRRYGGWGRRGWGRRGWRRRHWGHHYHGYHGYHGHHYHGYHGHGYHGYHGWYR